ncbi:hypothetical protein [Chryseobacterium lathyri]|jgi:hypothetical protein
MIFSGYIPNIWFFIPHPKVKTSIKEEIQAVSNLQNSGRASTQKRL